MSIDNYNYAADCRTQGPAKAPVLYFYGCGKCGAPEVHKLNPSRMAQGCDCIDYEYVEQEIELPMHWTVCPVCEGRGKHVNPSIDAGGISASDFHDDPDFAESYFRGDYDQTCNRCNGRTTVPGVDWDALTPEQAKAYEQQLKEEADDHACYLAEIRMGA